MRYTLPDYYREFACIASDCPATCCAGWQIVIDDAALKKYKNCQTSFGNRLANSIDWKEQTFLQYDGRCAFLDERNLCDIYTEAGADMLCRTCRNYPRHIEEFENEREISLTLSCPVVARMVLGRAEKVAFISKETEMREEDEDFDALLYFVLQDCRSVMFALMQERSQPVKLRMAMTLALAHDVQNRINAGRIFDIESVLGRYQRHGAFAAFSRKLARHIKQEKLSGVQESQTAERTAELQKIQDAEEIIKLEADQGEESTCLQYKKALLALLGELKVLDSSWPEQVGAYREQLFDRMKGKDKTQDEQSAKEGETALLFRYPLFREVFSCRMHEKPEGSMREIATTEQFLCIAKRAAANEVNSNGTAAWKETEAEQLMIYFLFTYFCGAVYDGEAMAKVKMAVVSTLLIQIMEEAAHAETLEERAQIAWRFSRELEHSDQNLEKMEKLMEEADCAEFSKLMRFLGEEILC